MEEWPSRCDEVLIEVAVKAVMFFLSLRVFFSSSPFSMYFF